MGVVVDIIEELEHVKKVYGSSTTAYHVALRAQVVIDGLRLEAKLNGKANKSAGVRRRAPSRKVKRNRMV